VRCFCSNLGSATTSTCAVTIQQTVLQGQTSYGYVSTNHYPKLHARLKMATGVDSAFARPCRRAKSRARTRHGQQPVPVPAIRKQGSPAGMPACKAGKTAGSKQGKTAAYVARKIAGLEEEGRQPASGNGGVGGIGPPGAGTGGVQSGVGVAREWGGRSLKGGGVTPRAPRVGAGEAPMRGHGPAYSQVVWATAVLVEIWGLGSWDGNPKTKVYVSLLLWPHMSVQVRRVCGCGYDIFLPV
jgi:hypothetical protein